MHSLSGFEASQVPDAIIGMEHMNAKKFMKAVKLLLKGMLPVYALSFQFTQEGYTFSFRNLVVWRMRLFWRRVILLERVALFIYSFDCK